MSDLLQIFLELCGEGIYKMSLSSKTPMAIRIIILLSMSLILSPILYSLIFSVFHLFSEEKVVGALLLLTLTLIMISYVIIRIWQDFVKKIRV